jgi:hypothetical protein
MAVEGKIPKGWSQVLGADTLTRALERLEVLVQRHLRAFEKAGALDVNILHTGPGFPKDAAELNADLRTLAQRCRATTDPERDALLFVAGYALGDLSASGDDDAIRGKVVGRGRPPKVSDTALYDELERHGWSRGSPLSEKTIGKVAGVLRIDVKTLKSKLVGQRGRRQGK